MKYVICAPIAALCVLLGVTAATANTNHGPSSFHAAVPYYESCLYYGNSALEYRPWDGGCTYGDANKFPVGGTIVHGGTGAQTVYLYYSGSSTDTVECYVFSYDSNGNQLAQIQKTATCNTTNRLTFNLTSAQRSEWGSETMKCFIPKYCYLRGYSTT